MAEITVKRLAQIVERSVDTLLTQINKAGLAPRGADDTVSDIEKQQLVAFLKRSHGDTLENTPHSNSISKNKANPTTSNDNTHELTAAKINLDEYLQDIKIVAKGSLDIVETISNLAENELTRQSTYTIGSSGSNIADSNHNQGSKIKRQLIQDSEKLKQTPTFMRVDLEDIDGNYCLSLYVTPVAPPTGLDDWRKKQINFVSYRSDAGRIAALDCGSDYILNEKEYYIARKVRFSPQDIESIWDCKNASIITENERVVFDSFRILLQDMQNQGIDVDAYLAQLKEFDQTTEGKIKLLTRNIRSSMSLRSQAALDQYQDRVFRLSINTQGIILGPPGTGKTTTLIKRLGKKLDLSEGSLDEPEQKLLKKLGKDSKGFNEWIMFTPSELLKSYLKEAFAKEGIVSSDKHIYTWEYAKNLARQSLNILSSPTNKSGYIPDKDNNHVNVKTVDDPRLWHNEFIKFIEQQLKIELKKGLAIVEQSSKSHEYAIFNKLKAIIDNEESITSKYRSLFDLESQINKILKEEKAFSDKIIQEQRNLLINNNPQILEEMARFLTSIKTVETDDEDEDADYDDDDIEEISYSDQNKALAAYQKLLKKFARFAYLKRSLVKNSNDSKLKEWLNDKLPKEQTLLILGQSISLQNGLRHNLNCWKHFYKKPAKIYNKFRKEEAQQHFYKGTIDLKKITQPELDLLLLVTLRNIKILLKEPYVIRNIDEVRFQEIKSYRDNILKDQVMVDEATDFSVLQLACMQAMTSPLFNSFFACGDFNQRLTSQGIKDAALLMWISPKIQEIRINTIYRQSPKLNQFSHLLLDLMDDKDVKARSELPQFIDHEGLYPALAEFLSDVDQIAKWITARIAEIEDLINRYNDGDKIFPSVVVLVKEEACVSLMADTLNNHLEEYSLKADPCLKGKSIGDVHDIRVCSIEYIKGLEFEAVFFVGIDELMDKYPNLYQKFIYVGATRAANYLGMTCSQTLPNELESLRQFMIDKWHLEECL